VTEAGRVLSTVAAALAPGRLSPVRRCMRAWPAAGTRPEAADPIRRALVLAAEHELNVSPPSPHGSRRRPAPRLAAATLSGLSTLSGPRHGGAWQSAVRLAEQAGSLGAREAIRA
jgi:citrate synthase